MNFQMVNDHEMEDLEELNDELIATVKHIIDIEKLIYESNGRLRATA